MGQLKITYKIYLEADDISQSRIQASTAFVKNLLRGCRNTYLKAASIEDESDLDEFTLRLFIGNEIVENGGTENGSMGDGSTESVGMESGNTENGSMEDGGTESVDMENGNAESADIGNEDDAESFVLDMAEFLDAVASAHSFMDMEGSFLWEYKGERKTYSFRSESGSDHCDFEETWPE